MITGEEMRTSDSIRVLPFRERVSLVINIVRAKDAIQTIVHAEQAGLKAAEKTSLSTNSPLISAEKTLW
jgi:hypothetical protein